MHYSELNRDDYRKALHRFKANNGLSLGSMAKVLGISKPTVSRIMTGERGIHEQFAFRFLVGYGWRAFHSVFPDIVIGP